MAKMKGKDLLVKVSTNDSDYYTISSMNDASMSISGDNQDITAFGATFIVKILGLKDVSYSVSGFFDIADTTGQLAVRAAMLADSDIYVQFLPNGTVGWKQTVKPSSFEVGSVVDGVSELSIELEGTGTITAV